MLTTERKRQILDRLRRDGRLVAKDFALELGISEDTVRRDLRQLAAEGLLARVHGGALAHAPDLPDFQTRRAVALEEKARLAAAGARLVQPGMLLFLDGGTTHEALIPHLPRQAGLTVATHSPTLAAALEQRADVQVWLVGGRLYRHSMVAVGAAAATMECR
jgi:DeoR/GlpR family transcriptional regulator of sugar metabolism